MSRLAPALLLVAVLAGCSHGNPAGPRGHKAIGCLPGDCPPHPQPTATATCAPRAIKAIGCLPGDCPPKPPICR